MMIVGARELWRDKIVITRRNNARHVEEFPSKFSRRQSATCTIRRAIRVRNIRFELANESSFTAVPRLVTRILLSRVQKTTNFSWLVCLRRRLACGRKEADVTTCESAASNAIDRNFVEMFAEIWNDEIRLAVASNRDTRTKASQLAKIVGRRCCVYNVRCTNLSYTSRFHV